VTWEPPETLRWEGGIPGRLVMIDQTLLPAELTEIRLDTPDEVVAAIRRLAVRGAPAIGIAGAYGLVLAAQALPGDAGPEEAEAALAAARNLLAGARPTAVNLAWGLERMARIVAPPPGDLAERLLAEARAIHAEDKAFCEAMGRHAAPLVRDGGAYLTHCNAGSLATGGTGTALAVFHIAARDGKAITVYADETRPLLQGARLTTWELLQSGIDTVLICDSAAATVITRGDIDAVFVGSDRIAANGDVANKLGTLPVALAARHKGIPFYVVAPTSTFDLEVEDGASIPIEERAAEEVTEGFGPRTAPEGVRVVNPAFDVTPADLVTAIICEKGVIEAPDRARIEAVLGVRHPPGT